MAFAALFALAVVTALVVLALRAVRHRYTSMDRYHRVCSPEKAAEMMREAEARAVQVVVVRDDERYRG